MSRRQPLAVKFFPDSADRSTVGDLYLESRLDFLRQTQNPDGGWGYFPGKQSWLEPTTYATLALHGTPGSEASLDRSWKLVRSWQTAEGSFRPSGQVQGGTWVTAHVVTLASVRGVYDDGIRRSVDWMLSVVGAEHNLLMRAASFCICSKPSWMSRMRAGRGGKETPPGLSRRRTRWWRLRKSPANIRAGNWSIALGRRGAGAQPALQRWRMELRKSECIEFRFAVVSGNHRPGADGAAGTQCAGIGWAARCRAAFSGGNQIVAGESVAHHCAALPWPEPEELLASPRGSETNRDIMLTALEALGHPDGNYGLLRTGGRA